MKAIARFNERQQLHAITDCTLPTRTQPHPPPNTHTHTHTHTTWFVPPLEIQLMEVPWRQLCCPYMWMNCFTFSLYRESPSFSKCERECEIPKQTAAHTTILKIQAPKGIFVIFLFHKRFFIVEKGSWDA